MNTRFSLPTDYQNFIHISRYARFLPDFGRRETYPETVSRYFDFMEGHLIGSQGYDPKLFQKQRGNLEDAMLCLEIMPSMRTLMTAGKALARDNTCSFNCFAGETEFVTKRGIKRFSDVADTDQLVLARDGEWRVARVSSFGKQPLIKITLRPGKHRTNIRHEIYATRDHRWFTGRGEVTDLQLGDTIMFNGASDDFNRNDWVRGFGFGDGTLNNGRARIRLCGDKAKFLPDFESQGECKVYHSPSTNGDPVVIYAEGVFSDWKELPETPSSSWLLGYYAADGAQSDRQPNLSTQNAAAAEYVEAHAVYSGLCITGRSESNNVTNYGPRSAPLIKLGLREECQFRVVAIEETDRVEEVYCVTEPVTGGFTLKHGILTGNCAYLTFDHPWAFDECLFVLLCGVGVGYSVERQYINQLPEVPLDFQHGATIKVGDSKEGWAVAFREVLYELWNGRTPQWDISEVRPAGSILKTFGGRASGPEPLEDLFRFVITIFQRARGRKLNSLEVHDIACKIGDIVVVGGVRRSAMISLSNLSDDRMRGAKSGEWYQSHPWRRLANNSVAYTEKPEVGAFMREWNSLYESKSGERGIFNREGARKVIESNGRRDPNHEWGVNPCSEIFLRPYQFCNLSEVVIREDDNLTSLTKKVQLATILGTWQSSLTYFPYLRDIWRENTEEERLLGVSLTGQADNSLMSGRDSHLTLKVTLQHLKQTAIHQNRITANDTGVAISAAITCVKPSGTVSQLVDAASGMHERHAPYYIRTVRGDNKDPMTQFMKDQGIPSEPDQMAKDTTTVFSFPMKSPAGAVLRDDRTAIEQLEIWRVYQESWCEHKPSITVSVRDHEWPEVGAWVWNNFDIVSGVSFLPHEDHIYAQAPYQECSALEYELALAKMPARIDWTKLSAYETEDNTVSSQTLACSGGVCEMVDIGGVAA